MMARFGETEHEQNSCRHRGCHRAGTTAGARPGACRRCRSRRCIGRTGSRTGGCRCGRGGRLHGRPLHFARMGDQAIRSATTPAPASQTDDHPGSTENRDTQHHRTGQPRQPEAGTAAAATRARQHAAGPGLRVNVTRRETRLPVSRALAASSRRVPPACRVCAAAETSYPRPVTQWLAAPSSSGAAQSLPPPSGCRSWPAA